MDKNENAFRAAQEDQVSSGAVVAMSSKGRNTGMQAMLSNSTSALRQELSDLTQPIHQQSQVQQA